MIFIGVQVFKKKIYIAFFSDDIVFSDKRIEIDNNHQSIEDFISTEILAIKDRVKLCVIHLVGNYDSVAKELLEKQVPIHEVDTTSVMSLDSQSPDVSIFTTNRSPLLAKRAKFLFVNQEVHVDAISTRSRSGVDNLTLEDRALESDDSFRPSPLKLKDDTAVKFSVDRLKRFIKRETKLSQDLAVRNPKKKKLQRIKVDQSIHEYSHDDLVAEIKKVIKGALHGYTMSGDSQRHENLSQRVLIDLVALQERIQSISQDSRDELSKPAPYSSSDSKSNFSYLVASSSQSPIILSPELIFEVFKESVGDGISGLYPSLQESSQYNAGVDDHRPLLEAFEQAKFTILPRILRGSNKYNNWLQNLLQLFSLVVEDGQELILTPKSEEGSILGSIKSAVGLGDDLGQKKITGKILVAKYVEGQEELNRKRGDSNFKSAQYLETSIYDSVANILRRIQQDKQQLPWSYSEIKANLYSELYQELIVTKFENVSIKDVYRACRKYYDNNRDSKIRPQIFLLLEELEIACSLTNIDSEYTIETMVGGVKVDKSWQSGPWLKDLENKHILQWGLEYNNLLAIDHQNKRRKEKQYIKINFSLLDKSNPNLEEDLLSYANTKNIKLFGQDGMSLSAAKWAIENNIRLSDDQNIEDLLMSSDQFRQETFLLFQMAIDQHKNANIIKYVKSAIRRPYIVNCYEVGQYLILTHEQYRDILDVDEIDNLYERLEASGVELPKTSSRSIDNLFRAVDQSDDKIKQLRTELSEVLYTKSKVLQKKISNKKQINRENLVLKLERCDQLYNLFASPILPLESNRNCCLLGDDSKLAKLFKKHDIKKIARQFDRNRVKTKKSTIDKMSRGARAFSGAGEAAVASNSSAFGRMIGPKRASIIAGFKISFTDKLRDIRAKTQKGEMKFASASEDSCKLTCSAELRRNMDLVRDVIDGKKISRNSLVQRKIVAKSFFVKTSRVKKELLNEITEADDEMKNHLKALESSKGIFPEAIATVRVYTKGALRKISDTFTDFFLGPDEKKDTNGRKSSVSPLSDKRRSSLDCDSPVPSKSINTTSFISESDYEYVSDEELAPKSSPKKPAARNHKLKFDRGFK